MFLFIFCFSFLVSLHLHKRSHTHTHSFFNEQRIQCPSIENYLIVHERHVIKTTTTTTTTTIKWPSVQNLFMNFFSHSYHIKEVVFGKLETFFFFSSALRSNSSWDKSTLYSFHIFNCANFHSSFSLRRINCSSDLNFQQIYLSHKQQTNEKRIIWEKYSPSQWSAVEYIYINNIVVAKNISFPFHRTHLDDASEREYLKFYFYTNQNKK